jgi:hypothetical protein
LGSASASDDSSQVKEKVAENSQVICFCQSVSRRHEGYG